MSASTTNTQLNNKRKKTFIIQRISIKANNAVENTDVCERPIKLWQQLDVHIANIDSFIV